MCTHPVLHQWLDAYVTVLVPEIMTLASFSLGFRLKAGLRTRGLQARGGPQGWCGGVSLGFPETAFLS